MTDLTKIVHAIAAKLTQSNCMQLARDSRLSKSMLYRCRQPKHLLTRPISLLVRLVDALARASRPKAPNRTTFPKHGKRRTAHTHKKKSS